MNLIEARQILSNIDFRYVKPETPTTKDIDSEFKTYNMNKTQFFAVLPRISRCEFAPSLEETVNYIVARETRLARLYTEYNGNPYCLTWFEFLNGVALGVGYETTSRTRIKIMIHNDSSRNCYVIKIPIARANGFHDLLVRMAKAGATEEVFEIRHNFYRVTKEEFEKYAPWWNSTGLGETLPSWEEYQKQCEARIKRHETRDKYDNDENLWYQLIRQEDADYMDYDYYQDID